MGKDIPTSKNVFNALCELRKGFFENTELRWEGNFPSSLFDFDCFDDGKPRKVGLRRKFPPSLFDDNPYLDGVAGKLRMWTRSKKYYFEFITEAGEKTVCRRPLGPEVLEGWQDYEELLFNIWPYDGVKSKWENEDFPEWHGELPEWHIVDPSYANWLELFASKVEECLTPLMSNSVYNSLCQRTIKVIRNGLPKWKQGVVQWTYIKDLDEVIKEFDLASNTEEHVQKKPKVNKENSNNIGESCLSFLEELSAFIFDWDFFILEETENFKPEDFAKSELNRYKTKEEALTNYHKDFFYLNDISSEYNRFFGEQQNTLILSHLQSTPIYPTILELIGLFEWLFKVLGEASTDIYFIHQEWTYGKKNKKLPTDKAYSDCQNIIMSVAKKIIDYQFARRIYELMQRIESYCKLMAEQGKHENHNQTTDTGQNCIDNTKEYWITVSKAQEIAGVRSPGTISQWVKGGKVKHNGKKGRGRRIEKSSLLMHLQERKERERQRGFSDYNQTLDDIPEKR